MVMRELDLTRWAALHGEQDVGGGDERRGSPYAQVAQQTSSVTMRRVEHNQSSIANWKNRKGHFRVTANQNWYPECLVPNRNLEQFQSHQHQSHIYIQTVETKVVAHIFVFACLLDADNSVARQKVYLDDIFGISAKKYQQFNFKWCTANINITLRFIHSNADTSNIEAVEDQGGHPDVISVACKYHIIEEGFDPSWRWLSVLTLKDNSVREIATIGHNFADVFCLLLCGYLSWSPWRVWILRLDEFFTDQLRGGPNGVNDSGGRDRRLARFALTGAHSARSARSAPLLTLALASRAALFASTVPAPLRISFTLAAPLARTHPGWRRRFRRGGSVLDMASPLGAGPCCLVSNERSFFGCSVKIGRGACFVLAWGSSTSTFVA
ncbi:hypothetical protein K438DRAFT_1927090 [Mycena galopus ATCC 62051]|nr:hypothetical protein K438DRAFT_1927090 [Mycena galopus ATCC 62051]